MTFAGTIFHRLVVVSDVTLREKSNIESNIPGSTHIYIVKIIRVLSNKNVESNSWSTLKFSKEYHLSTLLLSEKRKDRHGLMRPCSMHV